MSRSKNSDTSTVTHTHINGKTVTQVTSHIVTQKKPSLAVKVAKTAFKATAIGVGLSIGLG